MTVFLVALAVVIPQESYSNEQKSRVSNPLLTRLFLPTTYYRLLPTLPTHHRQINLIIGLSLLDDDCRSAVRVGGVLIRIGALNIQLALV